MTDSIRKTIEQLRSDLERHNRLYYVDASPEISDLEYDRMLKELESLEEQHPEYDSPDSPSKKVGGEPIDGFETVAHRLPMLSIDNVYNEGELSDFDSRLAKLLDDQPYEYTVEYKLDGVALALIYEQGRLTQALTRGNGQEGDDVTHNARTIGGVPLKLTGDSIPDLLEIRGEVCISNSDFAHLLAEQTAAGAKKLFANPRNTAAGALKLRDPKECGKRRLRFLAHGMGAFSELPVETHLDYLEYLKSLGIPVTPKVQAFDSIDKAREYAHVLGKDMHDLDIEVDGIVIKLNSFAQRENVGSTSKAPRWVIAYKWEKHEAVTTLEEIDIQVGKSGKLTPVAHLKPIEIDRTIVARASLHNRDEIERLGVKIGDQVVVEKAGKIIPHVLRVEEHLRTGDELDFAWPDVCPGCGGDIVRHGDSVDLFCANPDQCQPQLLRQIEYFTSRPAMDISHLGEKLVEQLFDEGFLTNIADIYRLDQAADALLTMERFGERSRDNLLEAVEESKSRPLWRLLTGLSIPDVGSSTARLLEQNFGTIDEIASRSEEDLQAVDGIGPQIAASIIEFFATPDKQTMIEELRTFGLNFGSPVEKRPEPEGDLPLTGKTIVVTGTLPTLSREDAKELIRQHGGKASSSVSKKTSYLLAGEKAGSKLTKAEDLGIEVLNEAAFLTLIGEDVEG